MQESPGREQDTERFVRLFASAQREVLRYILALVPDLNDADEILQETAVALWKRFDEYKPESPFVPWACGFAVRFVRKHREQKARRDRFLSLEAIDLLVAEPWEEEGILEDRRRALRECLKTLSDDEQLLIERRYSGRTTVAQMAQDTGRDVSALYQALDRVRRRLLQCTSRRLKLGYLQ